jgi:hypothetical protein
MNQPWKVILAFAGVFVAGAICGGPLTGWIRERQQENRPPFAERTMRRFEHELKLTDAQKERVMPILLRAQTEWRQARQENVKVLTGVIDRMHTDLSAELSPEQRIRLEEMRKEFKVRAERFRGRVIGPDRRPAESTPVKS